MTAKYPFREALDIVQAFTGKTQKEIAAELGVGATYISNLLTREENGIPVPQKFMRRFNEKYAYELTGDMSKKLNPYRDELIEKLTHELVGVRAACMVLIEEIAVMKAKSEQQAKEIYLLKAKNDPQAIVRQDTNIRASVKKEMEYLAMRVKSEAAHLIDEA